jgi:alkylation response protein AidB-like acyl-CoA dehydrogenase
VENKGMDYWDHVWEPIGLLRRGTTIGYLQRIYDLTMDYTKTRIQGGRLLAKHDIIAQRLADMYLCIELARQFIYKSCWELDRIGSGRALTGVNTLLSWAFIKEITLRIANHVCEIWGGAGIVKDTPIERFLRYAWSIRPPGGDITISLIKAGRNLVAE